MPAFTRRRAAMLIGAACCAAAISVAGFRWFAAPQYNVLLITLDTTRADRIGCYGYQPAETPALDALAKDGVLFERAYATVPLTLPSHASILTGLYPPENGIHLNGRGRLPDQIPTLADALLKQGYATGAFIASVVLYGKSGLDRGFEVYDDDMAGGERHGHESHLMRNGQLVVDSALRWLGRRGSQPFFCWVHLYDPHAPFEGHAELFGDRFAAVPYDGDIAFADRQVGRLVSYLKRQNLYDRTLIVVVGDHGEGFGEHDELEHGFLLYNPTLQAPLIVSCPPLVERGSRVSAPVSLVDIHPTVLSCLNLSPSRPVSGVSFQPALRKQPLEPRVCYSESEACYAAFGWAPLASITTDRWKYIRTVHEELYDLQADPGERQNLAAAEPEQKARMSELLDSVRKNMTPSPESDVRRDPKHMAQLRALGYVSGGDRAPHPDDDDRPLPSVNSMIGFYNAEIAARQLISSAPNEAVARLQEVTSAAPEFMPAWLTLGTALQAQNRVDEALETYRKALEINPESTDAHFDLAKLQLSQGRPVEAIAEYEHVLRIDPNYAMAHINLASILAERGEEDSARRHFEQGLEEFPDSTTGLFNYGLFLIRRGEFEAALPHLNRARELDPHRPQIHYQLGVVCAELEQFDEAAGHFEAALRINPRHADAASQLRRIREKL